MHLPANVRYPATTTSVTKTHESRFPLALEITVVWGLCWIPVLWDKGIIYIVNVSFQNRGILYFGTHKYKQEKPLPIIFTPHVPGELSICKHFFLLSIFTQENCN